MTVGTAAVVCTNSWAGRQEWPCRIVGSTRTRWEIEVDQETRLPGRVLAAGGRTRVPKSAVRVTEPARAA